ncbi:MAG: hypothetical protein KAW12_09185, partial [Candidatus Aminicenantes bacterium]|nr:hypothetical protein [Candidatus Aminicenantes bacterium]
FPELNSYRGTAKIHHLILISPLISQASKNFHKNFVLFKQNHLKQLSISLMSNDIGRQPGRIQIVNLPAVLINFVSSSIRTANMKAPLFSHGSGSKNETKDDHWKFLQ